MQPSNAEVRAGAVAKLKRAASLPRINGGRRPPMHSEGASEGEKSKDDASSKHGDDSKNATSDERDDREHHERRQRREDLNEQRYEQREQPNGQPSHIQPPSPKRRRRSRSRSRSRSKDLKDLKPPKSPPPRDSSPEEKLVYSPAFEDVSVASPTPTRPTGITIASRFPFSPPTAPSTPSPQASVPTLQDLQQRLGAGLFRSQSASRAAAMMKLTGGAVVLETPQTQTSLKPTVSRSNTIAGIEQRAAARQIMLGRLQHRVGGQTDETTTSGGEDAVPPAPSPKRRRRRSRKSSVSNSGNASSSGVNDFEERDPPSTSQNTPMVSSSPLLPNVPLNLHQESPPPPFESIDFQIQGQAPSAAPPSPPPEESHEMKPEDSHMTSENRKQWLGLDSPRRIVVEEDDLDDPPTLQSPPPSPPSTPPRDSQDSFINIPGHNRIPHSSDAPSADSTLSSGHAVPVIMSSDETQPPFRQDIFPTSPFNTPLKERSRDDEDEEIVYREEIKARRVWSDKVGNGNGIQWPGSHTEGPTVIPVQDEEEEEFMKVPTPPPSVQRRTPPNQQDPRTSEFTSPSPGGTSYAPPSPSSVLALSHSTTTRESADFSPGPSAGYTNLPNKTGIVAVRPESYTDTGTDWEESGPHTDREGTAKRATDGSEKSSTWARVKNTIVLRSGSITGRRSRANSTSKREDKASNRESAASGVSGNQSKYSDHGGPSAAPPSAWSSPGFMHAQLVQEHRIQEQRQLNTQPPSAWSSPGLVSVQLAQEPRPQEQQQRQLPMLSPAASISSMSLVQPVSHRSAPSPVPPASPADSRYNDSKLMPFPGLVKLDEERKKQRSRRMSASVSSPNLPRDVASPSSDMSHGLRPTEMEVRERKLSHQYSDSGLLQKFRNPNYVGSDNSQLAQPASNQATSPTASISSWLPMSRKDLKKWYKANKFLNTSSSTTSISPAMISPPILDGRFEISIGKVSVAQKKPSLSDILVHQPGSESATEWEDGVSATPKVKGKGRLIDHQDTTGLPPDSFASPQRAPRVQSQQCSISSSDSIFKRDNELESAPETRRSPTRPALSAILEPVVSDESWTRSASQASSSSSVPMYNPSTSSDAPVYPPDRSSLVLQRLDSLLSRDPNDHTRWAFLEDPPRKLVISSSVTQVVNSDTIRERFLFLFNDILVVAKPLQTTDKADRMFIVKNIIDLQTIHVITNRDEGLASPSRHPLVHEFVREFAISPDSAVASLLQSSGLEEDQTTLGKLLFNNFELDRTRLGGYLSKKSHKAVLRSYIDCFGFTGVRIDYALRTFVLSVRLPTDSPEHAIEHLLNTFASRWFEANARLVSFDKDLATKLVRIIVHLDNQIHKGGQPQLNGFGPRDFRAEWETMVRALDPRSLLPEGLILDIYYSLRRDPLRWAADSQFGRLHHSIIFKRPPPNHLAHRVQSDPITLRIPHPDPHLRIQLLSQDGLIFDPPELNFTRSMEVAFRVMGTVLGPKSIIFSLVGPNAPQYSGIPFCKTVVIERHFMRNTFQVAFDDLRGTKRRYMFSAEDALLCHHLALSLKQYRSAGVHREPDSSEVRRMQRAVKAVSLDVLREAVAGKLSGHDLIMMCKQNSLIPAVLPSITTISSSP